MTITITIKELKNLVRECSTSPGPKTNKKDLAEEASLSPQTEKGQTAEGEAAYTSECSDGMTPSSSPEVRGKGKKKMLLDEEPEDSLDNIRTVNQLVMQIRSKLQRITDPRALQTIMAVVDAVAGDIKTLKTKDKKTGGFATGIRNAIEKARMNNP